MTTYSPTIPSDFQHFIISFYKASDTPPSQPDPYLEYFTPNSPLIMGLNKVQGHEEITNLRIKMWENVIKRHHVVKNVAEITNNEVLINGYVEYLLKNGTQQTTEWAAHMKVIPQKKKDNDNENDNDNDIIIGYKMEFYQVYLSK